MIITINNNNNKNKNKNYSNIVMKNLILFNKYHMYIHMYVSMYIHTYYCYFKQALYFFFFFCFFLAFLTQKLKVIAIKQSNKQNLVKQLETVASVLAF